MDLGLNICFGLCTFLDLYIWVIFVFTWAHFAIPLAEYEFMTHGAWNFTKESETRKAVGRHWACCKLVWVHVLFLTFLFFPQLAFPASNLSFLPIFFFSFSYISRYPFFLAFFFFSLQLSVPTPIPTYAFSSIPPFPFSPIFFLLSLFFFFII